MKRVVFLLVSIAFCVCSTIGKTIIKMEYANGIYRIPCSINGARMKMIFDTGATSVSISLSMAQYLYENDYITNKDIIEKGQTQTADGRIIDHIKINIRELGIDGQLTLENVEAVVLEKQDTPLLLGQSAIQKLGKITIEGDKCIIEYAENKLSDEEIEEITKRADKAFSDEDNATAEKLYSILYQNDKLSNYGKITYAMSCQFNKHYAVALDIYKELIQTEYATPSAYNYISIQMNLFFLMAECYIYTDNMLLALDAINKSLKLIPSRMEIQDGKKINTLNTIKPLMCISFGLRCAEKGYNDIAASYDWLALKTLAQSYKISVDALWNICQGKQINHTILKNEDVQTAAFQYALNQNLSYEWTDTEFYTTITRLAKAGNKEARKYLSDVSIPYE